MNGLLFERATGHISQDTLARLHHTQLLHSFQPAPQFRFDGGDLGTNIEPPEDGQTPYSTGGGERGAASDQRRDLWAHQAGVNALALERFEGRILVSGGSDGTIRLWDLEQGSGGSGGNSDQMGHVYRTVAEIPRAERSDSGQSTAFLMRGRRGGGGGGRGRPSSASGHLFGVTHLSFYPFDAAAFLSSSFDQTLKLWSTERAKLSGSFDLGSKVYSHALSPIADHVLVACATQHPAVRLVDLRSGAAVQSLVAPGQEVAGAVLSVAWSPRHDHVLASGAVDGSVRIWDVRRASSLVALLDKENTGVVGAGADRNVQSKATAHAGPVNGLTWTDDGDYLVTAGHDRRIRVWDATTGANTLVHFGPAVRNGGGLASVAMVVSPAGGMTGAKQDLLFWPNDSETLVFRLHDGTIVTRLRGMGPAQVAVRHQQEGRSEPSSPSSSSGRRGASEAPAMSAGAGPTGADRSSARKNRMTSLVWRGAGGAGSTWGGRVMGGHDMPGALFSGHLDGQIRTWMPRLPAGIRGTTSDDEVAGIDKGNHSFDDGKNRTPQAVQERERKRRALDQAYRSLMGTQITFR